MSSPLIDVVINTIISTALSSSYEQILEFSISPEKARSILSQLDDAAERSSWRLVIPLKPFKDERLLTIIDLDITPCLKSCGSF